jgi:nitrogen fixation NifU-like protein
MAEPQEYAAAEAGDDPFWGRMNDPSGSARVVGLCGDDMEFYLDIRNGTVQDVKYYTNGCEHTRACGRAVAERAVGRSVMDVLAISPRQVIDALPQLSAEGRHCAILAVSALHRAVADFLLIP